MRHLQLKCFSVSIVIILLLFASSGWAQQTGGQDIWARDLTISESLYNYAFHRQIYSGNGDAFRVNYLGTGGLLFDFQADSSSVFLCTKAGSANLLGSLTTYMLGLKDTDRSHALVLKWIEDDTADRSLNFLVNGADRTINLSDDLIISALINTRLLATNGSGGIVSSDLFAWAAGTANQVLIADDGDGTITLATPQDIHTGATPTFVSMIGTGLTASRLVSSDGTKTLTSTNLNTWIAGTPNRVTVTDDGDGTITLTTPQDTHTAAVPTFAGQILTGTTNPLLDLNPSGTSSQDVINITPSTAIGAAAVWEGIKIAGTALDPSGADAAIYGFNADFSGIGQTSNPDIEAVYITMPVTYSSTGDICAFEATGNGITIELIDNDKGRNGIYVNQGTTTVNFATGATAETNYEIFSAHIDGTGMPASSMIHAFDVDAVGSPSGMVAALGVASGVKPVMQHTGTFVTPDQAEYAARLPDGGSWTDGVDGIQCFVADDDSILIGSATMFDALEVILTTPANKALQADYFYYDTSPAWIEFDPGDSTADWRQDGTIQWNSSTFTSWKSDYDPGAGDGSAGYYIMVQRTRVVLATPPTPTTVKILAPTVYQWDENGDLDINSLTLSVDLDISADTNLTAGAGITLTDDTLSTNIPGGYYREYDDDWQYKGIGAAADRYTLQSPAELLLDIGGTMYRITAQTDYVLSAAATWDTQVGTDYTVAANRAGKDFYIYAIPPGSGSVPLIEVSANSSAPDGYTTANSRKVGGFHCLCVAVGAIGGHTLTGFLAGDILPASVWDYDHRPACEPEGMVYSQQANIWVDIYLASGTGATTASVFGATITDTRDWMDFTDDGAAVKKRLLWDGEFQKIAAGSNEETNIAGGADPVTTGGHSDTAGRRMISNIGVEDGCGVMWQWLQDQSYRYDAGNHTHTVTVTHKGSATGSPVYKDQAETNFNAVTGSGANETVNTSSVDPNPAWAYQNLAGAKGSLYRQGTYGDVKLLAGAAWLHGTNSGSRARYTYYSRWSSDTLTGVRFASEPR